MKIAREVPIGLIALIAIQGQAWGCAYCRFCLETNHYLFGWFAAVVVSALALGLIKKFRAEFWCKQQGRLFLIPIAIFVLVYSGIWLALKGSKGDFVSNLLLEFPVPAGDSIFGNSEVLSRIQAMFFIVLPLVGAYGIRQKWVHTVWARVPCALAVLILPCYLIALCIADGKGLDEYSRRLDRSFLILTLVAVALSVLSMKTKIFQIVCMGLGFVLLFSSSPRVGADFNLVIGVILVIFAFKLARSQATTHGLEPAAK